MSFKCHYWTLFFVVIVLSGCAQGVSPRESGDQNVDFAIEHITSSDAIKRYAYKRDLPQGVQEQLDQDLMKMADADEFYNSSDVLNFSMPSRQFSDAIESMDFLCLRYKIGGFVVQRVVQCYKKRGETYLNYGRSRSSSAYNDVFELK